MFVRTRVPTFGLDTSCAESSSFICLTYNILSPGFQDVQPMRGQLDWNAGQLPL